MSEHEAELGSAVIGICNVCGQTLATEHGHTHFARGRTAGREA
jgi:hypothetical protein